MSSGSGIPLCLHGQNAFTSSVYRPASPFTTTYTSSTTCSSNTWTRVLIPHHHRSIIWTNGNMTLGPRSLLDDASDDDTDDPIDNATDDPTPVSLELKDTDIAWLNRLANALARQQGLLESYFVGTFSTSAAEAHQDVCPMSIMFRCVWPPGSISRHAFIRMLPSTQNRDLGRVLDIAFDIVDQGGAVKSTETVWCTRPSRCICAAQIPTFPSRNSDCEKLTRETCSCRRTDESTGRPCNP